MDRSYFSLLPLDVLAGIFGRVAPKDLRNIGDSQLVANVRKLNEYWRYLTETFMGIELAPRDHYSWKSVHKQLKKCKLSMIELAKFGGEEAISILLENERVALAIDDEYAIVIAIRHRNTAAVKLLLGDSRVNPAMFDNLTIKFASDCGSLEIVQLLLQDARVDPSAGQSRAIGVAALKGNLSVVELLLKDWRVDPSGEKNLAIRFASYNGHSEVVKVLLRDKRVDPSAENNESLVRACEWMFPVMSSDDEVESQETNNIKDFIEIRERGFLETIRLLHGDERVRSTCNLNLLVANAKNSKIVDLLLSYY